MGITIHFNMKSRAKRKERIARLIGEMKEVALDFPFDYVGDIEHYTRHNRDPNKRISEDSTNMGNKYSMCLHIDIPWAKRHGRMSTSVTPIECYMFLVDPGEGCETFNVGLARYPERITVTYSPKDDDAYRETIKNGGHTTWGFSWRKWKKKRGYQDPSLYVERREIPTRLPGWRFSDFCKTQYANNISLEHFLCCHVSIVTFLEELNKLPTTEVKINDETFDDVVIHLIQVNLPDINALDKPYPFI